MGKFEREFKGYHVAGHEEDYLAVLLPDGKWDYESASRMVYKATGQEPIGWSDATAFDYGGLGNQMWADTVKEYRESTGRQYPPLFKIKVVVEAEPLPEAEIAAYWEGKKAEHEKAIAYRQRHDDFEKAKAIELGISLDSYKGTYLTLMLRPGLGAEFEAVRNDKPYIEEFFESRGDETQKQHFIHATRNAEQDARTAEGDVEDF